jgi:gluconate 5-dehydrogenase
MLSVSNKVVLITGSSRGLGWSMAQAFAEAGAVVVLNGRQPESLQARLEELLARGASADLAVFDIEDSTAGQQAISRIAEAHGRLDVLINNAGIFVRKPFSQLTDSDWDSVFAVNVKAYFKLARSAAAIMMRQQSGSIIMISSIVTEMTRPEIAAYTAAKGAIGALTRALAVELGPYGVRCNAIAPGYFRTEAAAPIVDTAFGRSIQQRVPLKRWGDPLEIGPAAVFLASNAASYINGATLTVDGGLTAAL